MELVHVTPDQAGILLKLSSQSHVDGRLWTAQIDGHVWFGHTADDALAALLAYPP